MDSSLKTMTKTYTFKRGEKIYPVRSDEESLCSEVFPLLNSLGPSVYTMDDDLIVTILRDVEVTIKIGPYERN